MKNRIQNLLTALFVLALPALVQAQFTFTTNSGAITITGYNTNDGPNVVIPAMMNGYPVTTIGDEVFLKDTSITGGATSQQRHQHRAVGVAEGCTSTAVTIPLTASPASGYLRLDSRV